MDFAFFLLKLDSKLQIPKEFSEESWVNFPPSAVRYSRPSLQTVSVLPQLPVAQRTERLPWHSLCECQGKSRSAGDRCSQGRGQFAWSTAHFWALFKEDAAAHAGTRWLLTGCYWIFSHFNPSYWLHEILTQAKPGISDSKWLPL